MEDYLKSIVQKYKDLCYAATGERVALRKVATPFIDDDETIIGPKTPVKDGPCILCSYCGNTFPDNEECKFSGYDAIKKHRAKIIGRVNIPKIDSDSENLRGTR